MEKFLVDCYNILTIRIDIIGIYMNIISELVFFIILHLFLFYILLAKVVSLVVLFINSQLVS